MATCCSAMTFPAVSCSSSDVAERWMPRRRCRIDQHRETAPRPSPSFRNSVVRQAWRRASIGLRFVPIGHQGVEHVRAEAGLRDVAGLPMLVAEQRMQPAIRLAAIAEVVDQLGVSRPARRRPPAPGRDCAAGSPETAPPPSARRHRTRRAASAVSAASRPSASAARWCGSFSRGRTGKGSR